MTEGKGASGPPTTVGLIGCGSIAERYVEGMKRFSHLKVAGCADVNVTFAL